MTPEVSPKNDFCNAAMRAKDLPIEELMLFIQTLLFPVLRVLLTPFFPWLKKRAQFELKNKTDFRSNSFKKKGKVADFCFEIASEGELEQVRPLLIHYLEVGQLIELVYSSDSLEKKCNLLFEEYSEQLRIFRLPLLTYFPFELFGGQNFLSWTTASNLILCRYDFYPEILLRGRNKKVKFILLSGTLKNKVEELKREGSFGYVYLKRIYELFDLVVASSETDKSRFFKLGLSPKKIRSFDFRVVQINRRLKNSKNKLLENNYFSFFYDISKSFPKTSRLLLGSAWPIDLEVLGSTEIKELIFKGELFVTIAPHKLSPLFLEAIKNKLAELEIPFYSNVDEMKQVGSRGPGVLIFTAPGVLCELYSYFGHAYVGGGFGRSIHSVLEPYLANSLVYTGPKTFRSTEYELIKAHSNNKIFVLTHPAQFHSVFMGHRNDKVDERVRNQLKLGAETSFLELIDFIGVNSPC